MVVDQVPRRAECVSAEYLSGLRRKRHLCRRSSSPGVNSSGSARIDRAGRASLAGMATVVDAIPPSPYSRRRAQASAGRAIRFLSGAVFVLAIALSSVTVWREPIAQGQESKRYEYKVVDTDRQQCDADNAQ